MKRTLIALGVAAAVVAPLANAAPKVYGRINVSVENSDRSYDLAAFADKKTTEVSSNASRFGIQGEDELTASLSAVYQIEWEVNTDDAGGAGAKTDLSPRNRYIGIKHADLGTIKVGQYDSYLKSAEGNVDQFNDFKGDLEFTVAGQDRLRSTVGYESPKLAGLSFNIQAQGQEASTAANGRNGISSSVVYDNKENGLYAALAYNKGVASRGLIGITNLVNTDSYSVNRERESDAIRAVVGYKIADLALGALYQQTSATRSGLASALDEESAYLVSAAYNVTDNNVVKLQYSAGERDSDAVAAVGTNISVNKRTAASIGLDHLLTSKTRVYTWYTQREEEGVRGAAAYDSEDKTIGVGIDHRF